MFYDNENEFKKFSKEVKKINYNFQKQKRYKYTLLDKGDNGFIRMIYEDSCLSKYQKEKIEEITILDETDLSNERLSKLYYEMEDVFANLN